MIEAIGRHVGTADKQAAYIPRIFSSDILQPNIFYWQSMVMAHLAVYGNICSLNYLYSYQYTVTWRVFISLVWNYYKIWAALTREQSTLFRPFTLFTPTSNIVTQQNFFVASWSKLVELTSTFFNKCFQLVTLNAFQLVTQHCCVASWREMLPVLPGFKFMNPA